VAVVVTAAVAAVVAAAVMMTTTISEATMNWLRACILILITTLIAHMPTMGIQAQEPVELPAPNALLVYENNGATLVNISQSVLQLDNVSFWRAGSKRYEIDSLILSLAPGECVQVRTSAGGIPVPPECSNLVRWFSTDRAQNHFWRADYENEPFRPQLNGSALTICNTSALRCAFYIPQGQDAQKSWVVLDPQTNLPMPAGMQVAYDANQMWIGNFTQGTVMPTRADLRLIYTNREGQLRLWTPRDGPWDEPTWDNRGLLAGECIVLYRDRALVTPLLPCTPVAHSPQPDPLWLLEFGVMGPREERRAVCGDGQPVTGPVLCVVGG
jgi:hypothetical protein